VSGRAGKQRGSALISRVWHEEHSRFLPKDMAARRGTAPGRVRVQSTRPLRPPHPPAPRRLAAATTSQPPARWHVFLTTTPLDGAALLAPFADAAAALGVPAVAALAAPHAVVVLGCIGGDATGAAHAFDFLPAAPRAPSTAVALAAGRTVPGVGRARTLPAGIPRARCVEVGPVCDRVAADPVGAATAVVDGWAGADLAVGRWDCASAAVELAALLAGVEEGAVVAALARCASTPATPPRLRA